MRESSAALKDLARRTFWAELRTERRPIDEQVLLYFIYDCMSTVDLLSDGIKTSV